MQAIPYDFRKSLETFETTYTLPRTVDFLHELTGKKVVITAHSLGTLVTLRYLNSIDSVVKNKKIKNFIGGGI